MNTASSRSGQLDLEPFGVTFFVNRKALIKQELQLTLLQLFDKIRETSAPDKAKLPWLKLARFGETVSAKGCYRTNANMVHVTGIEAEHDTGKVSFKAACAIIRGAGLRAILYTTANHQPVVLEKWRILLPLAETVAPEARHRLVARLNALFDGRLAPESFHQSLSYYYGSVSDSFRCVLIEGDCLDMRPDLADEREPEGKTAAGNGASQFRPMTTADAEKILKDAQGRDGEGWHNAMLHITASLAAQRLDEEAIAERLGVYCREGSDDPQLWALIESAVEKFGAVEVPGAVKDLLGTLNGPELTDRGDQSSPLVSGRPDRPGPGATLDARRDWLLSCYGWSKIEEKVIDLWADSAEGSRIGINAFRETYAAWFAGKVTAASLWSRSPHRVEVAGVRMRPDQGFPLYEEGGQTFKNIYRKPEHASASGDIGPFLAFIKRLVPDKTEREWLLDWMAHKRARPDIPGVAVFFVADDDEGTDDSQEGVFGTGRGTLFAIAHRLYGEGYTGNQEFKMLAGTSSQAVYTDWLHHNVLVTVDEARESATAHRRGERSAVYEALKGVIDPAPQKRSFKVKYGAAFSARSYCSFWIATNHSDAMIIPVKDRRFAVLRNGAAMTEDEANAIWGWINSDGSIGALAAFLAARDLSGFNAMRAPDTAGKVTMAERSRTALEEYLRDLADDPERGLAFTRIQLLRTVENNREFSREIGGHFDAAWGPMTAGVKNEHGTPRQVRIEGTRRKVFCFRRHRKACANMTEAQIRREVMKWGLCDTSGILNLGVVPRSGDSEKDE